jgi:hypothetical protein
VVLQIPTTDVADFPDGRLVFSNPWPPGNPWLMAAAAKGQKTDQIRPNPTKSDQKEIIGAHENEKAPAIREEPTRRQDKESPVFMFLPPSFCLSGPAPGRL